MKKSKTTVEKDLDKAFASLDDYSVRELEAISEAIGSRRHPLFDYSSIFRDVASAREGGWSTDIPRFHLREYVAPADDELAAQIADAAAPFWRHVRKALASGIRNSPPPFRKRSENSSVHP